MGTSIDITALTRIAAEQEGVLSARDLADAKITAQQRRWQIARGWIEPVAPQVYRIAGAPDTHRQRLRIGLLSLGERSWVSFEAAAALHGLDRSDRSAVEFTIERGRVRVALESPVHTTNFVPKLDVVEVDGFRAMSATRTVLDLALARATRTRVEAAFDSAVRLGLSHPTVLAKRLATLRGSGRWGVGLIERILPDSGGHSPLERSLLKIVRQAELPMPILQAVQRAPDGRHIARVDFLFEDVQLVVEVSGRRGHTSDAERAKDARRRNELQDLGLTVVEYAASQVWEDEAWVRADLRRRLRPA